MEILRDPLALVDQGKVLELLVESGVVHRDAGMQGEGLNEGLVTWTELIGADLVGQVQPADGPPLTMIGTPRKLDIGGWFGGKP